MAPAGLCEAAGLCVGDTILTIDGVPTRGTADDATSVLKNHAAGNVVLGVRVNPMRRSEPSSLEALPTSGTDDSASEEGL